MADIQGNVPVHESAEKNRHTGFTGLGETGVPIRRGDVDQSFNTSSVRTLTTGEKVR